MTVGIPIVNFIPGLSGDSLMKAAKKGNVGIVRKLIHHGANVNLTNKVNQVLIRSVCTSVWQEDCDINLVSA